MWAALFPGQGSQSIGMGKFLYDEFSVAKELFEEASDTLSLNFKKLCFEGPEADLMLTENTQPALLLVSTCAERVLAENTGIQYDSAAGHSIGEYAAVVAARSISFGDAIKAVKTRGQAMQEAVSIGEGAMLAVLGLEDEQVLELCQWAKDNSGLNGALEPANFNSPGQVVISGHKTLADWVVSNATAEQFSPKPRRFKIIPLKVSAPFHCSLMKPAEEKMRSVLSEISFTDARFPVIQNTCAEAVTNGDELRENLIKQVSAPVQWVRCTKSLSARKVSKCIELGNGKVLQGLVKKIDSEGLTTFNLNNLEDLQYLEKEIANSSK